MDKTIGRIRAKENVMASHVTSGVEGLLVKKREVLSAIRRDVEKKHRYRTWVCH